MAYSELLVSTLETDATASVADPIAADPVVTASVYCAGRLDLALLRPVAELRGKLRSRLGESGYFWFSRYRRCGEHLKLRIHGPAALAPELRELVAATVEPFLAALPEGPPDTTAAARRGIPPIDIEDRRADDYPDRSLLFTTYERSHVSLGGRPLLDDDTYVEHLTRWLATSTDWILDELKLDDSGQVAYRQRQSLLIKTLVSALGTLALSNEQRSAYLHYHRDWLLRFALLGAEDRGDKADTVLASFQKRVTAMGAAAGPIERTMQRLWHGETAHTSPLRSLGLYVESFRENEDYRLDPFTREPAFPGVFKGLHGTANQLGLSMLDEAFTHHLLLRICSPERAAEPIRLMPD